MSITCPICNPSESCKAYPALWERLRRPDGERWRGIHDQINGREPEPVYPGILEQAGNLARAGWDWARSGFQLAEPAEQERRLAICHGCEFYDHPRGRCSKCGCVGSYKAWVAASHCPVDKW